MLARIAIAAVALSSGCGDRTASPSTPTGPSQVQPVIDIKLVVSSSKLAFADRGAFKVGFEAVNRGSTPIDPKLYDAVLTANGQRAYAWDLAIQNGPRDDAWSRLAPGQSVAMAWPLGEALFEHPGSYKLVLTLGAAHSTADVEVTP